jgi:ParB family transcriptional regulator, chromosome partitioning protein
METPEHETEPLPEEPRAQEPEPAMPTLPPRVEPGVGPRLALAPAVEERLVSLEALDPDTSFRLRDEGDVGRLAMDLARLGQAFPVEARRREGSEQLQLLTGFRRVAALRFLQRSEVLARIHSQLSDEDALLISLAGVLHGSALAPEEVGGLAQRLESEGRLSAAARDMLERAGSEDDSLAPELVGAEGVGEEEVDADELAAELTSQLGELNQDLAVLAPVFEALEPGRRAELLEQLRYAAQLVAYFEEEGEER